MPSIDVGCVKDFPGTWAEYRVYEGGLLQIVHRISSPEALAWSEECRDLYPTSGSTTPPTVSDCSSTAASSIPLRS